MRSKSSHTAVLFRHPTFSGLLGGADSSVQRMEIVKMARLHATMILNEAVKRVPAEHPRIIAAYKAKGINLVWVLDDNDDAVRFWLTLPSHDHTPAEKEAADLLRSCVAADEFGDVAEFRNMQLGINQFAANRSNGGMSGKLTAGSKKQIGKAYWDRVANGEKYGAAKFLAGRYDVSETTIHTIVKKYKKE